MLCAKQTHGKALASDGSCAECGLSVWLCAPSVPSVGLPPPRVSSPQSECSLWGWCRQREVALGPGPCVCWVLQVMENGSLGRRERFALKTRAQSRTLLCISASVCTGPRLVQLGLHGDEGMKGCAHYIVFIKHLRGISVCQSLCCFTIIKPFNPRNSSMR